MPKDEHALERFAFGVSQILHSLGIAQELIEAEHAALGVRIDREAKAKAISEARRLAGQKGKETRKARAAAGGVY